jgi:hypothetical protein
VTNPHFVLSSSVDKVTLSLVLCRLSLNPGLGCSQLPVQQEAAPAARSFIRVYGADKGRK